MEGEEDKDSEKLFHFYNNCVFYSYLSRNSVSSYYSFEIKNKVRFYLRYIFLALVLGFCVYEYAWFSSLPPANSPVPSPNKLLSLTTKQVSGNITITTNDFFPSGFEFCMSYNKYHNPRSHAFVCAYEERSVCKIILQMFPEKYLLLSVYL